MSEKPTVAVIMSTYNGEKYLAEQLDSILAQDGVHVELFIRDDGSKDSTRDILLSYAERNANVHLDFGENLGFARSFLTELAAASGFEYYAFSDQDDVWKPEKLTTAIEAIKQEESRRGKNIPIVWQSNCFVTDENLNVKRITVSHRRKRTIESFILRGHARGCAMVINTKVKELIKTHGSFPRGHDAIALMHTYANGGSSLFDSRAFVYYRQRGNNVSATQTSWTGIIKTEAQRFYKGRDLGVITAKSLLDTYGDELAPQIRKQLTLVAEHKHKFSARLKIVFSPNFSAGILSVTIIGKLKALLGWL